MGYTVFFSWQSDRSSKEGRSLIERALEEAVKRIATDSRVDEPLRELSVDKDTKNVPGSPRIFETILSKIEGASVFVADLTFCGNRAGGAPTPNPNVLVEYGYALKVLGENCVLSVMNSAHGKANRENMPFDLLNRRFPIEYHLGDGASNDEIRDARKELCQVLESALRAIFENADFKKTHERTAPSPGLNLADIISELEDNLDCALRPRTGDVFRRPSTKAWLENRNKMKLPPEVKLQLKNTYNHIKSWADVVESGLNPNLGDMELNILIADLKSSLPQLINRLQEIQESQAAAEAEAAEARPLQIHITPVQPQRPSSPGFLPDLSPKEIELLMTARNDPSGQINHLKAVGTEQLYVGKRTFIKQQNARAVAEWLGAVKSLVAMGLLEAGGPHGLFYRLTQSGFAVADLLEDFCRWSSAEVTIEARHGKAPPESLKIACTGIVKLPATYYEYSVRAGEESMRSEKEPQSLLLEGVDITELNGITWEPTDLSFAVEETKEMRSFLVERATDHKIAKFWIKS